jgi:hypothetical protein
MALSQIGRLDAPRSQASSAALVGSMPGCAGCWHRSCGQLVMSTPGPHTEQRQVIGGACLHTGTTPSTTLREAVPYFTGRRLHKERRYAA